MNTIEEALQALRVVESNGTYTRQQRVRVGGSEDTKLGAYGILKSKWQALAAASGYAGANWRDPQAQDSIARKKLERDYEELGSWDMAALAFRYGTQAARALSNVGYIEPKSVEDAGYPKMGAYMRALREQSPQPNMSVEGQLNSPSGKVTRSASPSDKRSEDIIRQHLRSLLNAQQSASAIADTDEVEDVEVEDMEVPE
jgi:hypothetical protein